MKFSIITPSHSVENIQYLSELYNSIINQTYTDWEWVLYLNNGLTEEEIPKYIRINKKVFIYEAVENNTNIGAIKNAAFHLGTGDVLVEVDHDDMLSVDCLKDLEKAFQDEKIGFVYSNSLTYHMKEEAVPHRHDHGWTYKRVTWKGKSLLSMNHFQPTSHSLCYIWYAPDHVRAWRATVYRSIGGHDPELSICDDHDLCIRTYLVTKMKYIPKPLYIYRITGDNTWLERNELIQNTTLDLFNKYVRQLAEKDAEDKKLLKIDLGGGLYPYKDYKTVDIRSHADYVADLNKGIPLPDNSVGVLHAHHILEHLKDPIFIMKEIHRVLADGGWAFIEVPSTDGRGAWQDPTHISFWNENSFLYYTNSEQAKFIDNTEIRFQTFKLNTYYPSKYMEEHNISVVCAVLVAVKDKSIRYPGLLSI